MTPRHVSARRGRNRPLPLRMTSMGSLFKRRRSRAGANVETGRVARRVLALALLLLTTLIVSSCGNRGRAARTRPIGRLPVHRCATTSAVGPGTPVIPRYLPVSAPLPPGLDQVEVSKLAWYEGDVKHQAGLKVLGPRGWRCSAVIATDGGWSLNVLGPHKQQVSIFGFYNGPGISTACAYFASAVANAPLPEECKVPREAKVTHKSDHLVVVRSVRRTGTARFSDIQLLYWYPALGNAAEGADCRVAATNRGMCDAILAEVKRRIGHELATEARKHADHATTVTNASPSNSLGELTAVITGANGRCLKSMSTDISAAPTAGDSFDLRRPGNGLTEGDVVAVPSNVQGSTDGCSITLRFRIRRKLGFFVVFDETDHLSWGPVDSRNLPTARWSLNLVFSG